MTMNIKCGDGAFAFMKGLEESAGDDLVYSLALENGNLFMCVTAFPSLTNKRFDVSEDNMRVVFHLPETDFELSQEELIEKLNAMIEEHIFYVEPSSGGDDNEVE